MTRMRRGGCHRGAWVYAGWAGHTQTHRPWAGGGGARGGHSSGWTPRQRSAAVWEGG